MGARPRARPFSEWEIGIGVAQIGPKRHGLRQYVATHGIAVAGFPGRGPRSVALCPPRPVSCYRLAASPLAGIQHDSGHDKKMTTTDNDTTQLIDRFGRHVSYARLSVTDRCDFRCVYCMSEDMTFLPRAQVLTLEEIYTLARVFTGLGVTKLRLTDARHL